MAVIKHGAVVEDRWIRLDEDSALPDFGDIVVSLERWQRDREIILAHNGGLGIELRSDQLADSLGQDASLFQMIALNFPVFSDGRSYSTGRLLRDRYGFVGELRAVGNVLRDQFLFMDRCGFDSLEVGDAAAVAAWTRAWTMALSEIEVFYQPAGDTRPPAFAQRRAMHREIRAS